MRGPSDETRGGQRFEEGELPDGERLDRVAVLLGIWRNDFQVAALAEREQRVACAAAGMHAAKCCADTGALLDKCDAAIEIAAAEKDVIEQSGHLIISEGDRRSDERSAREREKQPARNGVRHERILQGLIVALFWPRLER